MIYDKKTLSFYHRQCLHNKLYADIYYVCIKF